MAVRQGIWALEPGCKKIHQNSRVLYARLSAVRHFSNGFWREWPAEPVVDFMYLSFLKFCMMNF